MTSFVSRVFCTLHPMKVKGLIAHVIYAVEQLFEKIMQKVPEKFGSVDKFPYICIMLNDKM